MRHCPAVTPPYTGRISTRATDKRSTGRSRNLTRAVAHQTAAHGVAQSPPRRSSLVVAKMLHAVRAPHEYRIPAPVGSFRVVV